MSSPKVPNNHFTRWWLIPITHTAEQRPSHPSRSKSRAMPFAGWQKHRPAWTPEHHSPPEPFSSIHTSQPAPGFQCTKMHHFSENANMCWEGKRRNLWVQDPSPIPETDRWNTTIWSQQRKCPILQLYGRNPQHFWSSPKGLGKVPGQQQGTQKEVAVACQSTRRPALARQKQMVSNISHCRELILCQNLVFWECWNWHPTPHGRQALGCGSDTSTGAQGKISFHFCLKEGRFNWDKHDIFYSHVQVVKRQLPVLIMWSHCCLFQLQGSCRYGQMSGTTAEISSKTLPLQGMIF